MLWCFSITSPTRFCAPNLKLSVLSETPPYSKFLAIAMALESRHHGNYGPGTPHTPRRSDDNTAEPHSPPRRTSPFRRPSLLFPTVRPFYLISKNCNAQRARSLLGGQTGGRAVGRKYRAAWRGVARARWLGRRAGRADWWEGA